MFAVVLSDLRPTASEPEWAFEVVLRQELGRMRPGGAIVDPHGQAKPLRFAPCAPILVVDRQLDAIHQAFFGDTTLGADELVSLPTLNNRRQLLAWTSALVCFSRKPPNQFAPHGPDLPGPMSLDEIVRRRINYRRYNSVGFRPPTTND